MSASVAFLITDEFFQSRLPLLASPPASEWWFPTLVQVTPLTVLTISSFVILEGSRD